MGWRLLLSVTVVSVLVGLSGCAGRRESRMVVTPAGARRISVEEYVDKMKAGWIGQMAGVGWGAPTEFKYKGVIIPEDKVPQWEPQLINQFRQDDIYVEMTFLRTLELYGFDVLHPPGGHRLRQQRLSALARQQGGAGQPPRRHRAAGLRTSASSTSTPTTSTTRSRPTTPGLIAPGMPNVVIELGEKFGRLMNYGDGLYGGQFVGGMYAEAFFEKDIGQDRRGRPAVHPAESQYYRVHHAMCSAGTSNIPTTGPRPGS